MEPSTLNKLKPKTSDKAFKTFQSSRELPGLNKAFLVFWTIPKTLEYVEFFSINAVVGKIKLEIEALISP
jgi:hypothetical protein